MPSVVAIGKLTPIKSMFLGGRAFPFLYFADPMRSYGVDIAVGRGQGTVIFFKWENSREVPKKVPRRRSENRTVLKSLTSVLRKVGLA